MELWSPAYNNQDIKIKSAETVYDGHYQVVKLTMKHKCFNGDWSDWLEREQLLREDAACAILWDPQQDKIVLVEQVRVGLINKKCQASPWMIEIVAGLIDKGETPEDAIVREAKEEAGFEIKTLLPIGVFFNTPGGFNEKSFVYCGIISLVTDKVACSPDEDEDIKVHIFDWVDFQTFHNTVVTSASTLIAVQWLTHHHDVLREKYATI
mgnify:CR=1 FL=1|tara:strand:+ start:5432 stop:6058 length:627 start_codon:yes stop_codon:yes gene_type:complete